VQDQGAVRVDHALRAAGGPRGVAHRGRGPLARLGELGPLLGRGGDQRVVVQHAGRRLDAVADHDEVPEVGPRPEPLQQREQSRVHDHHPVFGVARDVGQLVRMEPEVEGMEHRAEQRDREVGLEVAVVVPAQRGDPVARGDA
jgi:hypothetical protein